MSRILITGASGFIGSNLAAYLQKKNHDIIGWDRQLNNQAFYSEEIDLSDDNGVVKAIENCKPDIIIHCAGSADVRKSVLNPHDDFMGNVVITHNLLFALHKLEMNHTRFVFLSSAGVYGNPQELPIRESALLKPLSPYALHKEMCEKSCEYFHENYNMDIKIARIFSAYGTGLKKQIFWDMYCKYMANGRLNMFGTGKESRDYIFIDDVVKSLELIAKSDSDDFIFNVASGKETTIREATELFADILGESRDIISFNNVVREGDPINWRADISRIENLGFSPTIELKDGLAKYVDWLKRTIG